MSGDRKATEPPPAPAVSTSLPTPTSFAFPYPEPYSIQVDLMQTVFRAIEDRKIAIVESPTGTGKSLTLLTSTLTWLAAHTKRLDEQNEAELRERFRADDPDGIDPPWVIERAVKMALSEHEEARVQRQARLLAAREKERRTKQRNTANSSAFNTGQRKRSKVVAGVQKPGGTDEGDERFLPEEPASNSGGQKPGEVFLSKEVRELMAKYDATRPAAKVEEELEEDIPKIFYTSRTHTQLRQLTSELLKTSFPNKSTESEPDKAKTYNDAQGDGVSMVPLGSRKQLCINDKVRALAKGGDERMNEACLDMQKSGKERCEYLPKRDDEGLMLEARDSVLASVKDIEDIVVLGRKACVCPYYSTRRAVKQAQLVTLPYNLLLQDNAREALDINLKDQIVVIDEAHNLIDTLLSIYSTSLTSSHLVSAISQLQQYLDRFQNRLKSTHSLNIRQTLSVLHGLVKVCENVIMGAKANPKAKPDMLSTNTLMARIGGGSDQVNLIEMVRYLKESKLARKVSGYTEHNEEVAARKDAKGAKSTTARHASIAAFHQVEAFLLSLTDARDDGRIMITVEDTGARPSVRLQYLLLNPAQRFKQVVDEARCVILAGGTMEPISDFLIQLFPTISRDRFSTLSCSHVIPKSNLLTQVICRGPRKIDLEFKFANREDDALMAELGSVIQSMIGLVPDGVVVFLPSYAFLNKVKGAWEKTGLLRKLDEKRQVFYEPQTSGDVESILRDYALAISSGQAGARMPNGAKRRTGAILFAVVGGKLSEGINFSDGLGRCVIMVGLPFANVGSVELQERMRYVESLPGAGKDASRELYENLCMRAVNQSIGRAIRHAGDYATILLLDRRYAQSRIRNKLPKWIGEDVKVQEEYGGAAKAVAMFFKEKRERLGGTA